MDDNLCLLTAQGSNSHNILVRNGNLFSCYTGVGSYKKPQLYVQEDPNETSVSLNVTSASIELSSATKTVQLTATVLPESLVDKSVTWSSSDTEVATVSSTGLVTGVATGTAVINVTTNSGSKTDTCTITVTDATQPVVPEGTVQTFDSSEQGYTNAGDVTSADILSGCITAAFADGKYYDTGTAIRVYGGKTFSVTSTKANIMSITLTFGSGDAGDAGTNAISSDIGTYSDGVWSPSSGTMASEVVFTVGGSSGHRRVMAISVQYYGAEDFAYDFLTHTGCTAEGSAAPTISWSSYSTKWGLLFAADQTTLTGAQANQSGTNIQKAVARYDYIVGKYLKGLNNSTYNDFMGRDPAKIGGAHAMITTVIGENTNTVAIIVIISLVSVTAIGGYFFLKKRREQN